MDSAAVCFSFQLNEIGTYQDLYTFCSDTYEDDVEQRIACQLWLTGYAEQSVHTGDRFGHSDLLQVYPNPATDHIVLNAEGYKIDRITIYNPSGEILWSKETGVRFIDVSFLSPGIYMLAAEMDNKVAVKKIIVQ